MATKVILSWSGGKDSALALHRLREMPDVEVSGLLTTVTRDYERISMHGVRRELLERQAEAAGLSLEVVYIPRQSSNEEYEAAMRDMLLRQQEAGVSAVAFGDIFLADLRRYREEKLAQVGMGALFPLWEEDTAVLARRFIAMGFQAYLTCVDSQKLSGAFAGRHYDADLLADLPAEVDPCGENGEFHSFVADGPVFAHPVACRTGEVVLRESRFYYCDLLP